MMAPDTDKILAAIRSLNDQHKEALLGLKQELRESRTDLKEHMGREDNLIANLVNRIATMEGKVTMLLAVIPLGGVAVAIIAFIRGGP